MLLTVLECWLVMQTITSKTLGLQPVLPRYKQGEKRGFPLFECCFEIIFFQATRLMFPPTSSPTTKRKVNSEKFPCLDTVLRSSFTKPLARSLLLASFPRGLNSIMIEFTVTQVFLTNTLCSIAGPNLREKNRVGKINTP